MKWAFFGNIHSNFQALEAVLNEIKSHNVKEIYCLGDIVGYFNEPKKCVEKIRKENILCVMGNHDKAAIGRHKNNLDDEILLTDGYSAGELCSFSEELKIFEGENKNKSLKFVKELPMKIEEENFIIAHANPFSENFSKIYEMGEIEKFIQNVLSSKQKYIITAHGSQSRIIRIHNKIGYNNIHIEGDDFNIEIDDDHKYWINLGTTGGPYESGKKPKAEIMIMQHDKTSTIIKIKRIEYNAYNFVKGLESNPFFANLALTKRTIDCIKKYGICEKVEALENKSINIFGMIL